MFTIFNSPARTHSFPRRIRVRVFALSLPPPQTGAGGAPIDAILFTCRARYEGATIARCEDALAAVQKDPLPPAALDRLTELRQAFVGESDPV
jgi:hypothetical protein